MAESIIRLHRPGSVSLAALPPLSLYVHLPWCLKKCPYCDFNSHEVSAPKTPLASPPRGGARPLGSGPALAVESAPKTPSASPPRGGARPLGSGPALAVESAPETPAAPDALSSRLPVVPEAAYLDAVIADLEQSLPLVWGRRVHSIFIGGGTPSLFSPAAIDRLLGDIRARLPLEPGCEITLEANPGTFERDRFRAFHAAGVTRLSIGVQSFDDEALKAIGRVHDSAQARAAVEEAREVFDTFNIDLMYALPGQTLAALQADLDAALAFRPPHLSIYHLTLEPNTFFSTHPPPLPDDDLASDMLDLIVDRTAATGLQRYEVSAFARGDHRCWHNLNYWQFGDYLGIGAGAHGKLSFPNRILRQVKWREPAAYMAKAMAGQSVSNEHEVARDQLPFEFMLNALRLKEGFTLQQFSDRTGLPASVLAGPLQQAQAKGLVTADAARVQPTARGFDFLSDLQALFLP